MLGKTGWEKGKTEWEKETTADEMVGWHQRFNGHEFEKATGDGEGQAWPVAVHGVASSQT